MKRTLSLVLLMCLLFALPSVSGAVDALDLDHAEMADGNIQLLLPKTWDILPSISEPPLYTFILYDTADTDMERYVMLSLMPKSVDLPEEISSFYQEAVSLFETGDGIFSTLTDRMVIDRMDAIHSTANDEPYELVFINDQHRYLFLMYPDLNEMQDETFSDAVHTIVQSIALLSNPHAPRYDETAFTTEAVEGGVMVTGYTGDAIRVDLPPTINGETVVALGDSAFFEMPIQHISLPDTIEEIGENAFSGCNYLRTVELPANLKQLSARAFESCMLLQRVTFPSTLETIGAGAFWACQSIRTLYFPASLKTIGEGAFVLTTNLSGLGIEEGNTTFKVIDNVLFTDDGKELILYPANSDQSHYAIPEGVETIAPFAFSYATRLQDVELPSSLHTVHRLAFVGATGLRNVVIPASVQIIDAEAFLGATDITFYGETASSAETYAASNGFTFESLESYVRP